MRVVRHGVAALALLLLASLPLHLLAAQNTGTITGRVMDSTSQQPLSGVRIQVARTDRSTLSSGDGSFQLTDVPAGIQQVRASRIGYALQQREVTVTAGATVSVDFALNPHALMLEAVVTTGYGTQSSRDATGAVGAITEQEFNRGVISSPEQLLQGRMAGVQVTTASGEPGAGANIRIRGTSSVRAGNQPLFVVDGVPMTGGAAQPGGPDFGAGSQSPRNPLAFLNPDDIENISILKDASAAAIYGSRGSNGVVLITTKRGASGPSTTVSSSMSVSSLPKKLDLLTADEYVSAGQAAGADPTVIDFGAATDWQDQIFRTAVTQDQYLSYAERTETGAYHISLGWADQNGIVQNASLKRLTARINADRSVLDDRLKLQLSLTGSRITDHYAPVGNTAGFTGNLIGAALQANPTRPVFNPDGTYFLTTDFNNPMAMLAFVDDEAETNRILASGGATLDLTDWLSYKLNLGYENTESVRRTGIDSALGATAGFRRIGETNGRAEINNLYVNSQLIEHTLNLRRPVAGGAMEALAGFSYQRFENRGDWLRAEYFTTNEIPVIDNVDGVNNATFKAFTAASNRSVDELQSFFGRVNYNYDDRYLVTANFRVDGSTKFGRNNRYGYFPSLALAWRLSNEGFFAGLRDKFSDLKLRAGYGITGNQEFESGVSLAQFRTNNDGSLTQVNNPNPDIKWEETAQWGLGLDFELSGGRVGGSVDYFNKTTSNLIFRKDYAQPAAVDFQWVNLDGDVVNKGAEIALHALPLNSPRFSWRVDYNMSFLDNVVRKLGTFVNTGQIHGQGLSGAYAQRIAEGQPLYAFYMRQFVGFDSLGLGIYANNEQLAFVGSPIPDMTLGLTNTFTFGRFDVSAFLEGAFGHQIYNNTANAIFLKGNLRNGRNVTRNIAASAESPNNFGEASTRFLEDGDYVRLSNVTLGYNVPVAGVIRGVRNMRIGVTGQNLLLFTGYSGYDPEVNTDKSINGVPSLGIDYTAFPRPRTFTFYVQLEL
jgi:TonB-dependent starch-binding outer membrane protein SusC